MFLNILGRYGQQTNLRICENRELKNEKKKILVRKLSAHYCRKDLKTFSKNKFSSQRRALIVCTLIISNAILNKSSLSVLQYLINCLYNDVSIFLKAKKTKCDKNQPGQYRIQFIFTTFLHHKVPER